MFWSHSQQSATMGLPFFRGFPCLLSIHVEMRRTPALQSTGPGAPKSGPFPVALGSLHCLILYCEELASLETPPTHLATCYPHELALWGNTSTSCGKESKQDSGERRDGEEERQDRKAGFLCAQAQPACLVVPHRATEQPGMTENCPDTRISRRREQLSVSPAPKH